MDSIPENTVTNNFTEQKISLQTYLEDTVKMFLPKHKTIIKELFEQTITPSYDCCELRNRSECQQIFDPILTEFTSRIIYGIVDDAKNRVNTK